MAKRLVEIDDALLDSAREALGSKGVTGTVRAALEEAVASRARAQQIEWLTSGGLDKLADPEVRDAVWR
ncbi:DUF2191 domain-containing protein [Mycobacteroides abscessus]|uniref:type II toxin-antitoxin system VapB family antitoxin n=1 Tax=Mycobacteroides abscessus TaxID=36809 RepID=UPI000E67EB39|nr:type II toxin-antitoxin system VapB family antitoxin [Mycobacteroides abscessus]RIS64244.1 DUF2191 domain-containing protein [Mycobacteroides abscessus]